MVNNIIWGIILFTGITILSPPTVWILVIGMLPTGVSYLCDKSLQKHASLCVGALNLCGVFPYILEIWFKGKSFYDAIDITTNLFSLMTMYLAASMGWILFRYLPPIITALLNALARRRLAYLRRVQHSIVEKWGIIDGTANLQGPLEESVDTDKPERDLSPKST